MQILDTPGCPSCIQAEKIIKRVKEENNLDYEIEVIDITKKPEILQNYQIMSAPGIVIDGEVFKGEGSAGEVGHMIIDHSKDLETLWREHRTESKKYFKK